MKHEDTINVDIKGTVNGAVVNHGNINQTVTNHIQKDQINKETWYHKWWLISVLMSLIGGGLTWWTFNIPLLGLGVVILVFVVMLMFNPKRRFFRIALSTLALGCLQFSSFTGLILIPKNDFFHGFIRINEHTIPWFGVSLIILSAFLFFLDYRVNREINSD